MRCSQLQNNSQEEHLHTYNRWHIYTYLVLLCICLEQVNEDVNFVNHIRHLFLALRDPLADHAANLRQCNMNNSLCLVKIFFIQIWIHVFSRFLVICKLGRVKFLGFF